MNFIRLCTYRRVAAVTTVLAFSILATSATVRSFTLGPAMTVVETNVICVGITADRTTLAPKQTANLVARAMDADGDTLKYEWTATGGALWPDGDKALFDSTDLPDGEYVVTVVANDGEGHTCDSSVRMIVRSQKRV